MATGPTVFPALIFVSFVLTWTKERDRSEHGAECQVREVGKCQEEQWGCCCWHKVQCFIVSGVAGDIMCE